MCQTLPSISAGAREVLFPGQITFEGSPSRGSWCHLGAKNHPRLNQCGQERCNRSVTKLQTNGKWLFLLSGAPEFDLKDIRSEWEDLRVRFAMCSPTLVRCLSRAAWPSYTKHDLVQDIWFNLMSMFLFSSAQPIIFWYFRQWLIVCMRNRRRSSGPHYGKPKFLNWLGSTGISTSTKFLFERTISWIGGLLDIWRT